MTVNSVEQEILIEAPAEVVWTILTQPQHITQWFSDTADVTAAPGTPGVLTFNDENSGQPHVAHLQVVDAEPPSRFVFRWDYPAGEQPGEGNSLHVEFTLTPTDGGTLLRVHETGFDRRYPDAEACAAAVADHVKGWGHHLPRLQAYAPDQV